MFHIPVRHTEHIRAAGYQVPGRQIDTALPGSKSQHIENTASYPVFRICRYTDPCGNTVSRLKADAVDIFRKPVRVLPENLIHLLTVSVVYPNPQRQRDAVLLKEQHSGSLSSLAVELRGNLPRLSKTYTLDLRQSLRLRLHHPHRLFTELFHNPGSQGHTDSLNSAGAEITLYCFTVLRLSHFISNYFKLVTVGGMGCHVSEGFNRLTFVYYLKKAD